MSDTASERFTCSARSGVTAHKAPAAGHGSSRTWQRTIGGRQYAFTAILMPDGERRYSASRLDGADGRFDCSWKRAGFWTVPAGEQTADDIITRVTLACDRWDALDIINRVRSRAMLVTVADLLYVEPVGHGSDWLRTEIVKAARA